MHFDPLFARSARTSGFYATEPKQSANKIQRLPPRFFRMPCLKNAELTKKGLSTVNLQAEREIGTKSAKKA